MCVTPPFSQMQQCIIKQMLAIVHCAFFKILIMKCQKVKNFVLQHDKRLENRFRVLEDRAFHQGSEELERAEKLSLQEDWFADNFYSGSPANQNISELG